MGFLSKATDELRKLILDNPELPICVLAGEESWDGEHVWTYCASIVCKIEEILDCDFYDNNDCVFVDRESLQEKIEDDLWDHYKSKSKEEYDAAVEQELKKYAPYWKKVIAIYASN